MDSTNNPGHGTRRRTPEVVERLQRSRDRLRDRRAAQRQREQAVSAEVKRFIADWQAITRIEQVRDREISDLQRQMVEVKARAQAEAAEHRHQQALAAANIRAQGYSDEDTAELLEITLKQARRLIAEANADTTEHETRNELPGTITRTPRAADTAANPSGPIAGNESAREQPSDEGSGQMQ
ncbi:hypothetical protein [Nocardia sp. XZ_19_385]|uniref:hypothetical protein n=1 Tax=Nocardia sp. XZ_19_385 TaxID=2769488 RepID=UPI00188EFD77|nr:hypothetical protein [Nocardia sp. XZ_19_385]